MPRSDSQVALPSWRNRFHLTVPDSWMNDPQRPIWHDGAYHLYYLYNEDYPDTDIKSWRHASTVDAVHFTDHGVAVPKNTEPNADLWSGSLVVDSADTAGFGPGAIVGLITQPDIVGDSGAQAQFLWYSTDGGRHFTNASDEPVIPNPGRTDFRDPKLVWHAPSSSWICVLAEGHELGFYTSKDLRTWAPAGRLHEDRYGILECPDLFQIEADDGTAHWVVAASVNQIGDDHPGTYGYWVGTFDGHDFSASDTTPAWLDHGSDWYAAVTWPVQTEAGASSDVRMAIAWMNNWAYAHHAPTFQDEGFNGVDSLVREIRLCRQDIGTYRLRSKPVPALAPKAYELVDDHSFDAVGRLDIQCRSCHLEANIHNTGEQPAGIRVHLSQDGSRYVEIGVDHGTVYVDRSKGGDPSDGRYGRAQVAVAPGPVSLDVFVDHTTVEVFINDQDVLSVLAFSDPDDVGLATFGPAAELVTGDLKVAFVE